jgi:hypothetical protein
VARSTAEAWRHPRGRSTEGPPRGVTSLPRLDRLARSMGDVLNSLTSGQA